MKLEDLGQAQKLGAELVKTTTDLRTVESSALVLMTLEGVGTSRVVTTLAVPPKSKEVHELTENDVLFEALVDVMLAWHRKKIDRLTGELAAIGVEA